MSTLKARQTLSCWDTHHKGILQALEHAKRFLHWYIPDNVPEPEIDIDHDGDVMIEWDFEKRYVLTIYINRYGKVGYASLIGNVRSGGKTKVVAPSKEFFKEFFAGAEAQRKIDEGEG